MASSIDIPSQGSSSRQLRNLATQAKADIDAFGAASRLHESGDSVALDCEQFTLSSYTREVNWLTATYSNESSTFSLSTGLPMSLQVGGDLSINCDAYMFSVWAGNGSRLTFDSTGIGFFDATPVARPTVTGSRGGNAALASLLTALASLGLITDSSS